MLRHTAVDSRADLDVFRFVPTYFEADIASGKPTLTQAGRKAVQEELKTRA